MIIIIIGRYLSLELKRTMTCTRSALFLMFVLLLSVLNSIATEDFVKDETLMLEVLEKSTIL